MLQEASKPDFQKIAIMYIAQLDETHKAWRIDDESLLNAIHGLLDVSYDETVLPLQSELSTLREDLKEEIDHKTKLRELYEASLLDANRLREDNEELRILAKE